MKPIIASTEWTWAGVFVALHLAIPGGFAHLGRCHTHYSVQFYLPLDHAKDNLPPTMHTMYTLKGVYMVCMVLVTVRTMLEHGCTWCAWSLIIFTVHHELIGS